MTSITFDSLSSAKRLREKGVPQDQAEAFASELRLVSEVELNISHLATKEELKTALAENKADIIKYMFTGFIAVIGLLVAVLFKLH